ncbi:MAG TPA: YlxR family protein [Mycobacteriales bacterium]|nr:YlxR family protein [Mycobacteriales bacterium]
MTLLARQRRPPGPSSRARRAPAADPRARLVVSRRSSARPPQRTCVGCRRRGAQNDLLRVVVEDGALAPDPTRSMPGRGAYIHLDQACWEHAERRKAWPRALRVPGPLDATAVRHAVNAARTSTRAGRPPAPDPAQESGS